MSAAARFAWTTGVAALTALLCLPFLRSAASLGDEGVLLNGAQRMLRGERLYQDIFEILPPGGLVLTAGWLRIAGESFLSVRILAIGTIVAIACLTYAACWRVSRHAPLSAALVLGWVVLSQGLWTQLNHHWIVTMCSMTAAWAALKALDGDGRDRRWPVIAGLVAGAGAMVTPAIGAVTMLALLAAFTPPRRRLMDLVRYCLSGLVVPGLLIVYLAWNDLLRAAIDDVIVFAGTRYAPMQAVPFGYGVGPANYPLIYVFPAATLLAIAVWLRGPRDRYLLLVTALALSGLAASFPRPDVSHIAFEVPLACPLIACAATRLTQAWTPALRFVSAMVVLICVLPGLVAFTGMAATAARAPMVATARGPIAFFDHDGIEETLARLDQLPRADRVLFYPFIPLLPYLSGRQHVTRYDVFTPGYTTAAQYRDACAAMMRDADWAVTFPTGSNPEILAVTFPLLKNVSPPEWIWFERALDRGFAVVARMGLFELRQRRAGTSDGICDF